MVLLPELATGRFEEPDQLESLFLHGTRRNRCLTDFDLNRRSSEAEKTAVLDCQHGEKSDSLPTREDKKERGRQLGSMLSVSQSLIVHVRRRTHLARDTVHLFGGTARSERGQMLLQEHRQVSWKGRAQAGCDPALRVTLGGQIYTSEKRFPRPAWLGDSQL